MSKVKEGDWVWDCEDLPYGTIVMDDSERPGRVVHTNDGKRLHMYHEMRPFPYIYLATGASFGTDSGAINYSKLKVLHLGHGWTTTNLHLQDDPQIKERKRQNNLQRISKKDATD